MNTGIDSIDVQTKHYIIATYEFMMQKLPCAMIQIF